MLNISKTKKTSAGKWLNKLINEISMWILLLPAVLALIIVMWGPITQVVGFSFYKLQNYIPVKWVGLQNYKDVFSDPLFFVTLKNSFLYVFWSLVIGFAPPVILAVMLNEMMHFKTGFRLLLYIPVIAPSVAAALIWYFMFLPSSSGVLNTFLNFFGIENFAWLQNSAFTIPLIIVTMTWKGTGSSVIIYLASLQSVNQDLYEATAIDGAGVFQRFWHVTLPHLKTLLLLTLIRQIINIFQIMQQPMILTDGGPNNASLSINLHSYLLAFRDFQPEKSLALNVVVFIILMLVTAFYFFVQRKLEND